MDFEESMAQVRKVVNFANDREFAEFNRLIMEMAKKIPIAQTGLADIAAAGGQLGVAKADLPEFIKLTAKMAVAFDMTADRAGESMAMLANVFRIPITNLWELGDAINHLSDNTAAKASTITEALGRMGGVSKQFGLTAVQTAALAGAMISLGKPPEVAARGLNYVMQALQTADKRTGKFQKALAELGVSAKGLKTAIEQDAQGALLKFLERIEAKKPSERAGILADLFGTEWSDDIAVLVGSLGEYRKAIGLVSEKTQFAGSMTREFDVRSRTARNQITLFINNLRSFGIELGNSVIKPIGFVLEILNPLIDKFRQLSPTTKAVIMAVLGLGAIAGPVILAMAGISWAVGVLGTTFAGALLWIGGVAAALVPMAVGLGVASIGWDNLGSKIDSFLVDFPKLRGFFWGVWTALKDVGGVIADLLGPQLAVFKESFSAIAKMMSSAMNDTTVSQWNTFGKVIGHIVGGPLTFLASALKVVLFVLQKIGEWIGKIAGWFSMLPEWMSTARAHAKVQGLNWGEWGDVADPLAGLKGLSAGEGIPEPEGRQRGGPVWPRRPYLVGERGPELFVPTMFGSIIPALTGAHSQTDVNIRVTAEHGTSATVEKMQSTGPAKVRVATAAEVGVY
jgi:TP901 family phage tail tape measure protein